MYGKNNTKLLMAAHFEQEVEFTMCMELIGTYIVQG